MSSWLISFSFTSSRSKNVETLSNDTLAYLKFKINLFDNFCLLIIKITTHSNH